MENGKQKQAALIALGSIAHTLRMEICDSQAPLVVIIVVVLLLLRVLFRLDFCLTHSLPLCHANLYVRFC